MPLTCGVASEVPEFGIKPPERDVLPIILPGAIKSTLAFLLLKQDIAFRTEFSVQVKVPKVNVCVPRFAS